MNYKHALMSACVLLLTACATTADDSETVAENTQVKVSVCKDPRPQMCTMEYAPVCANVAGKRLKTYGNACSACGDVKVKEYVKGECITEDVSAFPHSAVGDSSVKKNSY